MYLLINIFANFSIQYQPMIVSNLGDYETIQLVSIIYLLIYSTDIFSILLFDINQLKLILMIMKQCRS